MQSDHFLQELAAQRHGEFNSAAQRHELARAASAGRPTVFDHLRLLAARLHRDAPPAEVAYRRTWVLARSTGSG